VIQKAKKLATNEAGKVTASGASPGGRASSTVYTSENIPLLEVGY
jgi:hypothetical protein